MYMINSKPNNSKYNQGNYIPMNKEKVIKLNNQGGVYYRSGWEKRIMVWMDTNESVTLWGAENIHIPYQMTHFDKGDPYIKNHTYYPDFYYEMRVNGELKQVVMEVKPQIEYNDVILLREGKFNIPQDCSLKKLKSLEYKFKMAQKNSDKWDTMIKWCNKKGFEFIIVTELTLKKKGIL